MNNYKPEYLGRVIPADSDLLLNLIKTNFEGFSKIYDVCKKYSDKISDIQNVDEKSTTLRIRIITDNDTLTSIKNDLTDPCLSIDTNIISAKEPT